MSLRSKLAKLKKLLLARDSALVVQGVELAVATEDPEVIDSLLDGVTYDPERDLRRDYDFSDYPNRRFRGGLVPNKIFKGSGPAQPFHDLAVIGLVSLATVGDLAPALRARLISLVIGSGNDKGRPTIPLRLLAGLDRLLDLRIEANNDVADVAVLAQLPRLARVQLDVDYRSSITGGLAGLGRSASLESLSIESTRLDSLDGLEGGQLTELEVEAESLEHIEAIRGLPITRLAFRRCAIPDVRPIASLPRLETLELDGCAEIQSLAALGGSPVREIRVNAGLVRREPEQPWTAGIVDLRSLTRLDISGSKLTGIGDLRGVTALERLRVSAWGGPLEMRLARPLERLREMSLSGNTTAIGDARWYPELRTLEITNPTDLDEVARLPALKSLELRGKEHVRLDALPAVKMKKLDLYGCKSLVSIRGVGSLRGLERLILWGCTSLARLDGLEKLDRLRLLDLRDCASLADVSALETVTSLRAILVDGCPLIDGDFPESVRWCVTAAPVPDIDRLLERQPPARREKRTEGGPVPGELMPAWEAIERALQAPSYDAMNQIADIARDAGSVALYDALLLGATHERSHIKPGRRLGSKPALLKRHLVRRLIAEAPAGSTRAAALRPAVTRLWIRGRRNRGGNRWEQAPVDLAPLAAFRNLERVMVESVDAADNPGAVAALPALRELSLDQTEPFDDLGFLGSSPVIDLRLGSATSLAGVERLPSLERLSVSTWEYSGQLRDLATLAEARGLRSLSLGCDPSADLRPLWGLAGLTELSLSAPQLEDLAPLCALENLESLSLEACSRDLSGLRLPKLRRLALRPRANLRSLAGAELPSLIELTVSEGSELVEIGELPPSLQALRLEHLPAAADLSPIGRAPRLWYVRLLAGTRHDLGFITGVAPIERLEIHNGKVRDVSAAAACPTLVQLALPYNNAPVDLAPLADHRRLESIRVPLSYVHQPATPEPVRAMLSGLDHIDDFKPR